ncbi:MULTISPECIES: glucosyltransferase domain-containing protein [unclassified Campylobacter]|uniref:glucosyltransferase domain-containing protein n=1 Tax=unclassified Campylobacter TaxID=2593542 RepID=UPI0022EA0CE2|nr:MULTISPECIES: glucosyltransferase domain-containing protein [unclassified Campylobacter]MDA3043939.1 glucosyltransferase domain-containing protein [Campylobacter sp. JMF_09 ED2]MDA3045476.1 glucosyltransferase domain-containing protein [Campylobacter sp. JMF_07 ED4]MDA3064104.1 glucosyltransferase domain-containing protein [Campylobacter sp. JMF_11 EL3]MDA3072024.1 glucosyltransferase domain-containing protein [Campylobacter sp. VBCF_03 NA9]MDA3075711.1 glucosyltransferase domain-containing
MFYKIIHMDFTFNTDISPIPQLVTLGIVSLASLALCKIFTNKLNFMTVLATVPVGLSPFYLENMSFKFDSPFMAIALALMIFPFLFVKRLPLFAIISLFSVLIMSMTYQAANSVFIIISIFLALKMALEGKKWNKIFKFCFVALVCFILPLLFYKIALLKTVAAGYAGTAISDSLLDSISINILYTLSVPTLALNGSQNVNEIFLKFSLRYLLIAFIIFMVYKSKINKILALFLTIICIVVSFVLQTGTYLVLSNPTFDPRVFMGFGVIVSIIFLGCINRGIKPIKAAINACVIFTAYFLIIQSSAYANALEAQYNYNYQRMSAMQNDLNRLAPLEGKYRIWIKNTPIRFAPVTINASRNYPIIPILVTSRLGRNYFWSSDWNYPFYGFDGKYFHGGSFRKEDGIYYTPNGNFQFSDEAYDAMKCTGEPLREIKTRLHTITEYPEACFIVNYSW